VKSNQSRIAGRHFLQIPGPTPVPERIQRAISQAVLDHRGPAFQRLGEEVLRGIRTIFRTSGPVVIYPASGTGAWEAALVNALSAGDKVLMFETGHFSTLWKNMATRLGIEVELIESDWRVGADPGMIEARLAEDRAHKIKAVCVVHNETSTGCLSPIAEIRAAIDRANHPALFLVDTISSLGSVDYRHEEWGVDVTVSGSQKGLMLPPGLSFTAVSEKALRAAKTSNLPKIFWSWEEMLGPNEKGFFPYTPATTMLYGLNEAIAMLHEEGLENVFARHHRHAEATRFAVDAWGLENLCRDPRYYSPVLTAVLLPKSHDADVFRKRTLEAFDISLGAGLTKLAGRVFRIGHLGDTNDLTILGALGGVEMGLRLSGVPLRGNGVQAALDAMTEAARAA